MRHHYRRPTPDRQYDAVLVSFGCADQLPDIVARREAAGDFLARVNGFWEPKRDIAPATVSNGEVRVFGWKLEFGPKALRDRLARESAGAART
jgi:hypothetical protein